jgi:hypothetical protein
MSAPAPSPELLQAISGMKPVRTRSPHRILLVVVALWSLYGAIPLIAFRLRPDLPFLPAWWVAVVAVAWWAGFIATVVVALLPARGQVVPHGGRALATALVVSAALIALGALLPRDAPGHSIELPLLIGIRNCGTFALMASILPVAIGLFASRRVVVVRGWCIGAALGTGAGALSGLILHLLCPVGGAAHASLAHGGAVVMCGLIAALIAARVLR